MGLFGRRKERESSIVAPSPFVVTLCERIGVSYGGWDTVAPLPPDAGGRGALVTFHIDDGSTPVPEIADGVPAMGTGIVRVARVFADRTEVYDGEVLIARFDDLSVGDVFGG